MTSEYNRVAARFGLPAANIALGVDVATAADLESRIAFLESELTEPETEGETAEQTETEEAPDTPDAAETGEEKDT